MSKQVYGQDREGIIIDAAAVSAGTATVSAYVDLSKYDFFGFCLLTTSGGSDLDGNWKFEIVNDYGAPVAGSNPGQVAGAGTPVDITASGIWTKYGDAIAAVAHGTATSLKQYVQAMLAGRTLKITFTRTAGSGTVTVALFGKSQGT